MHVHAMRGRRVHGMGVRQWGQYREGQMGALVKSKLRLVRRCVMVQGSRVEGTKRRKNGGDRGHNA